MEEKKLVVEQQMESVEVITTETGSLRIIEESWQISEEGKSKPIVVTGFGKLDEYSPNFSEKVVRRFYREHGGKFEDSEIDIMTGPWSSFEPIPVRYSYVNGRKFDDWLKYSDARLYVHLGEITTSAAGEYPFFLEKQAKNCPGKNPETGKCGWTIEYRENNEGRKCEEDGEEVLKTSFDISSVIDEVGSQISIDDSEYSITPIESHDAGTSLCDFLYYRSLYYAKKLRSSANVLFIHVPHFGRREEEKALKIYVSVLHKVIRSLLKQTSASQTREQVWEWGESITTEYPPSPGQQQDGMPYAVVQKPRKGQRSASTHHESDIPMYVDPTQQSSQNGEGVMYSYPDHVRKKQPSITTARRLESDRQDELYAELVPQKTGRDHDHDHAGELSYATVHVAQKTGKRAAHTKKQARESRKRRRQKRNARLRNHK